MKKLMIIGAGFLQTFVIKKAKELGYYILAVDGNPEAEGFVFADEYKNINIVDEKACLKYAKEKHIDGVMTAATDFGVLTAAYIAKELGLPGLNYTSAKLIKNKYQVRKCLFEYHVDDTEQAYEVTDNTNMEILAKNITFPVMVKPCDGSGSRGTRKVEDKSELEDACLFAINNSITGKAEIETFIKGQEYGVESFVENGNIHVLAVMRKWMTAPPYYAELGHGIPSGLSPDLEERIKKCVKNATLALGINFGAVNMDLLITEDQKIHIIDVGARMGGNLIGSHIIYLGTGIDYLANLIRATVNDSVDMAPLNGGCCVATRLLALRPGKIKKLPDIEAIEQKYKVEVQHHLHTDDEIREYHTNLDGCGYIISTADTILEAETKAESAKREIDKEIMRG